MITPSRILNRSRTRLENFDLVGINYVGTSLKPAEFVSLRQSLVSVPENFTIIATHYYMDKTGALSSLGRDIEGQLIVKPTIVMTGHVHADFIREKMMGPYPLIEDLTNYQNGIPSGDSSKKISAGTFYTVSTRDGRVEKISSQTIWISPRQSLGNEHVLYDTAVPKSGAVPSQYELIMNDNRMQEVPGAQPLTLVESLRNSILEFLTGLSSS